MGDSQLFPCFLAHAFNSGVRCRVASFLWGAGFADFAESGGRAVGSEQWAVGFV